LKIKAPQPAKKFPVLYEHVDTYRAQKHSRPCPEPGQTIKRPYLTTKKFISILFTHLCLGLNNGIFPTGFPSKFPYPIPISPFATQDPHITIF